MKARMKYSNRVYLIVEHLDGEDFDYWIFNTFKAAMDWLSDYPVHSHNWILSSEPAVLPESEFTEWIDPTQVQRKLI